MIAGYQYTQARIKTGNITFSEAIDLAGGHKVFIEEIDSPVPSLQELASLKNDYEISRALPVPAALKSLALVKTGTGIAVVKEHFNGLALADFTASGSLTTGQALVIAISIATMLHDIHARSIIHKDINPANLLIQPETLEVKVSNFRSATLLSHEQPFVRTEETIKSALFYISPEETGRMNRTVDYRADFYSFGVTLYYLLCGRLPFTSTGVMELVHAHIAKIPEEPSRIDPGIPQQLSLIVMKLLAKNAEDRYQSALGIKADLVECLAQYRQTGTVAAFRVAENDYSPTFSISEKLYGRRSETGQLVQAFEQARRGHAGLLMVTGYSGIGKTRLINEVHKPVAKANGYFAFGKFDQYNRNIPYSAPAAAFGMLIRQLLAESAASLENWKRKILQALDENAQVLTDIIPELGLLTGRQPSALKLGFAETQERFFGLFRKFVRALATEEHPLVIFIDDLQWADSGSLDLLFSLMTDDRLMNILIIGAYRDQEVSLSHPLMLLLDRLAKHNRSFVTLTLAELDKADVNELIADSLREKAGATGPLTEIVLNKTRGNPFFINQFLQKLVDEKLIFFDETALKWKWMADDIQGMNVTDNVVDLLLSKIQTLPPEAQHVLTLAACIRNRFKLETLAVIAESSESAVAALLWQAVHEDILSPTSPQTRHTSDTLWEDLGIKNDTQAAFRFRHDRIQQAAYSLIPEKEKKQTHLRIGRLLLKESGGEVADNIFDIVRHFNDAEELVTENAERDTLARLNLKAGARAKNANSHKAALGYFDTGLRFIVSSSGDLYNDLLIGKSECEYLCGYYAASEQTFDTAVRNAPGVLDKAEVLARKMQLYENTSRHTEAIKAGLEGLKLLGIRLPEKPGTVSIMRELLKTKYYLRNKTIETLKASGDITSPVHTLAMKIMINLWGPAYLHNQNLLALAILRMVNMSARFGNAPESALAYAFYGFVCCAQLKDFKNGYEFGKLGIWLNEKFDDKTLRAKVYVIFGGCIAHWKADFSTTLEYLRKAHEVGVEVNDLIYAGYALNFLSKNHYLEGDNLESVYGKYKKYIHFGKNTHHLTTIHHLLTELRHVGKLMGVADDPEVFQDYLDHAFHTEKLLEFAQKDGVALPLTSHHIYEAEYFYLFGQYEKALSHLTMAQKTIASMLGLAEEARANYHHSLTILAICRKTNTLSGLPKVRSNQKKLKKWAQHAEGNFKAKYLLVEAELAAAEKKFKEASTLFMQAKEAAQKSNIIADLALVNEQTATFFKSHGFDDIANLYLREALGNYRIWEAHAKAAALEQQLLGQGTGYARRPDNNTGVPAAAFGQSSSSSSLDLQSIFKASTSISGEVVYEKLLQKLLTILIENAGAQTCTVFIVKNEKLYAVAQGDAASEQMDLFDEIPVDEVQHVSQAIVQFVFHSQETVIIQHAEKDQRFLKDAYLAVSRPKSILCQPIILHGKCTAILYLENNLASDAFTPERSELLSYLSAQIAVSIQNAGLYKKQHELSVAYQRFVPYDFISTLGSQSILDVKLGDNIEKDMTVMSCDIRSYTTLAEGMTAKENFILINTYLTLVGPVIRKNNGFINHFLGDGFIALFENSTDDALQASIEMNAAMESFNRLRVEEGKLPIVFGIGLHRGQVTMGIIGDDERHDANVISDAVNIASRLEGLTKYFGANVVLSEETKNAVKASGFSFRYLGCVKLKGKEKVVNVYEMYDADEPLSRKNKSQTLSQYNDGLKYYFNKEFFQAASCMKQVLDKNGTDKTAMRYLQNSSRYLIEAVPDTWNGVEQMTEK